MSSDFNPSRLTSVEHAHAHAQGHTLIETDRIHWSGEQPITAPGEHGGTVPCSRGPRTNDAPKSMISSAQNIGCLKIVQSKRKKQ